ncbi:MAG: hypothetical protein FWH11_09220 [Micrococcales bacterium]|nr:hypothetical protein [Micrococcales bacterium]
MNSSSSRPFLAASAGLCLGLSSLLGACSSSGGLGARSTDGLGATVLNSVKEKHKYSSGSSCPSGYVCWSYSYGGSSSPDPDPIPRRYELKQDIPLGTCYDTYSKKFDLSDAEVVDCDTQHVLEVVSTFTWTAAPEGQRDEMVWDQVESCWKDEVRPRLRTDEFFYQTNVDVWYPSAVQIRSGSTTGYCMLRPEDTDFLLVGSLVDDTYRGTLPAGPVPQDVRPGTCYDSSYSVADNRDDFFRNMDKVDCDVPHMLEVISTFTWSKAPTGRDDPMIAAQVSSCWNDVINPKVADDEKLLFDSRADIWFPTAAQIAAGEKTGYCTLTPESYTDDDSDLDLLGSLTRGTYRGVPTEAEAYIATFVPDATLTCRGGSLVIDDAYSQADILVTDDCESITVRTYQTEVLAQNVGTVIIEASGTQTGFRAHGILNRIEISSDSYQNSVYWEVGDPVVVNGSSQSTVQRY